MSATYILYQSVADADGEPTEESCRWTCDTLHPTHLRLRNAIPPLD